MNYQLLDKDKNTQSPKVFPLKEILIDSNNDIENILNVRYPSMGFEMNGYMERSDQKDPTCIRVDMNDAKIINFTNNVTEKEEVIFTYGLNGCVATGLILEMNDGVKKAILTHNDPLRIQEGGLNMRKLAIDINKKEIKRAKMFILAPGEYNKNNEGKWELTPHNTYKTYINLLETTAKVIGGSNTDYSELQSATQKDQGTFRIVKNKDGGIKAIAENYNFSEEVFS